MCFRPGDVDVSRPCPNCGKMLHATSGVFPKKCPFCETSLAGVVDESALSSTSGAASAVKPPSAPKPPSIKVPPALKIPGAKPVEPIKLGD